MPYIQRARIHAAHMAVKIVLLTGLLVAGSSHANAALQVNGFNTNLHDRFSNSASFIGNPYDWSGVGRTAAARWGTLISDSYVIGAWHHQPAIGDAMRFYETNNPAGSYAERTILSSTRVGSTDLWIGEVGAATYTGSAFSIEEYSILNLPNLTDYLGLTVHVTGQSANAAPDSLRVGRNVIDGAQASFSDPVLGSTVGDIILYDYDTGAGGLGADEARAIGGDSGGPSFVVVDGQLAVAGIHWFNYTADDDFPNPGSGDTLVSDYVDDIDAILAASGESVARITSVPEPATVIVLFIGCLACSCRRRKRLQRI